MPSTISHRPRDKGPKAREMVAALWSRSGARAAPAQIRAPTTRVGQGMRRSNPAATAPTPSHAAAPDNECAGPIMVLLSPPFRPPAGGVDAMSRAHPTGDDHGRRRRFRLAAGTGSTWSPPPVRPPGARAGKMVG